MVAGLLKNYGQWISMDSPLLVRWVTAAGWVLVWLGLGLGLVGRVVWVFIGLGINLWVWLYICGCIFGFVDWLFESV